MLNFKLVLVSLDKCWIIEFNQLSQQFNKEEMSNHKQDKVNTDLQQKINDLEQDRFQVSFNSILQQIFQIQKQLQLQKQEYELKLALK